MNGGRMGEDDGATKYIHRRRLTDFSEPEFRLADDL